MGWSGRDDYQLPERLPRVELKGDMAREEFYRKYPAEVFTARLEARRRPPVRVLSIAGAMAAAAAVLVFMLMPSPPPVEPGSDSGGFGGGGIRFKGARTSPEQVEPAEVELRVTAAGAHGPVAVEDGGSLPPGAALKFHYSTTDQDFLMVISVDARGSVYSYYPGEGRTSIPAVRGAGIPLPGGVELDEYLGPERFFALFSSVPLTLDQVEQAVASSKQASQDDGEAWITGLKSLPLGGCVQTSLLIHKTGGPR